MLKIYTESSEQSRSNTGIQTFKNYFISIFHEIKKILIERFTILKISPIDIKAFKQSKQNENSIIARVYEINQSRTFISFLLDDIKNFIECRYYKKQNQELKIIPNIILVFEIYKDKTITQLIFRDVK